MPVEALLVLAGVIGAGSAWAVHQIRVFRAANALTARLRSEGALLVLSSLSANFRIMTLGGRASGWRSGVVSLTREQIALYPRKPEMDEQITFEWSQLRWFGRPVKYHSGRNEIWLHFEQSSRWHVVRLRMSRYAMADLVRTLKETSTPELVTAYRRRRPYIHFGPVQALPAEEDIHGVWTLAEGVSVYVTPLQIVLMENKSQVSRLIPLEAVRQVAAMRRIDQPRADGLMVFEAQGEKFAFATKRYEELAQAVADAARRSLEVPLLQKQKGKEYDDDE